MPVYPPPHGGTAGSPPPARARPAPPASGAGRISPVCLMVCSIAPSSCQFRLIPMPHTGASMRSCITLPEPLTETAMSLTREQLDTLKQAASAPFPFAERCGAVVEALEVGYCRMRMPFEPNINHVGTMYAGALFTLAEL